MQFAFTDDHTLFRDAVRDLLARECTADVVRGAWSHEAGRAPAVWAKLAEMGVVGLTAPERHGGLGMTDLDLVLLLEEAGRAALPEPLVATTAVGIPLLAACGQDDWVEAAAAGKALIAIGLGDRDRFGFGFGERNLVEGAACADLLVLASAGSGSAAAGSTSTPELHAVTPDQVTLTPQTSVDGSRRIAAVAFTPTAATCIATGDAAHTAIDLARDRGAVGCAAQLLGLARRMLDMTVAYTTERKQFGKPIGTFQALKHHMADALVAIEIASPMVYRAAYSLTHDAPDRSVHASMAKAYASDAATLSARKALQCHAAMGYSFEYDLHLWMKRTWALAAAWGDAAHHRRRIADAIL